jgi:predicted ATP-grasp superfamily ATP-dependent carboligase
VKNKLELAVVIPWAEGHSGLCCIRALGKKNIKVIAASSDKNAMGFYSKYTKERVLYQNPSFDFNKYSETIINLCKRKDVLTIFPLTDNDIYILSKYKYYLQDHIKTLFPSFNTIMKVQDRLKLYKIAKDLDIPTLETWLLGKKDKSANKLLIVKPRYSVFKKGNKLIKSTTKYINKMNQENDELIINEMGHIPIVQEYISGEEYGFYTLYNNGRLIVKIQQHRIRSANYKGGCSSFREIIFKNEIEKYSVKLLNKLKWHGPAMVEFKRDKKDGKFKLIEVNPRFWGSLCLSFFAGLDFPYLYYELAKYNKCNLNFDLNNKVRTQFLRGEINHLLSILINEKIKHKSKPNFLKNLFSILVDTPYSKHDIFDLDDFRPFYKDIKNLLRIGFSSIINNSI